MKKLYIGLLMLTVIGASCSNNGPEKCPPCPLTFAAINMLVKVKIVDKTTGADLFLSPNSLYKPTDLNVTSSISGQFNFRVDSSDTNNRSVALPDFESQTYTLKLATLSADNIKIAIGPSSQKCCAVNEVKSIMLNDSLVCTPCSPQQAVTIKK